MKSQIFLIVKKKKVIQWLNDEDLIIKQLKNKKLKNKWKLIAKQFKNKTPAQVYLRSKILDPRFKKGKFSKEEDEKIKKLV